MVVTRRQQGAPTPASRTNSAQPIPRVKGKVPAVPDVPSPLANGGSGPHPEDGLGAKDLTFESDSKKGKGRGKGKKGKGKSKKGTSFVDLLARVFLLWFTIYTLSVCPNDDQLKSPLCRGLYTYRKLVLEPYVVPAVQHALAHPSVAPYVDRARPVIEHSIAIAKPVALRAQSEWINRVVPQWNKRVVPQYRKHVVPQLKKHLWPYIERAEQVVQPYISRVQIEYETKVGPAVRTVAFNLYRWQHLARPYVVLAAHRTYDGYQIAKPYAIPLLQRLQALLVHLAQILGEQRRQFVDPHLKKIWERVNELGNGETTPLTQARGAFSTSAFKASASLSSVISSVIQTGSNLVPEASEAVVGSASAVLPDVVSESEFLPTVSPSTNRAAISKDFSSDSDTKPTAVISSVAASVTESIHAAGSSITDKLVSTASSLASVGSSVIVDKVAPPASSIAHESIVAPASSLAAQLSSSASALNDGASSTVLQATKSIPSSASDVLSTASSVIDEVINTLSSSVAAAVPTGPATTEESEDDFDILSFLGFDQDEGAADSTDSVAPLETQPAAQTGYVRPSDEEIAAKRAEITGRHSKWEDELKTFVEEQEKLVKESLQSMRKAATAELRESKEIHQEIDSLVNEAEKYLKGAEKYLGTLRKESRTQDDKKVMWERVEEKVEQKFNDRLTQTETVVNGWYARNVEKEAAEVQRFAAAVRSLADHAQADIGLDYAWLEDVTVKDWQRYHDLARKHESFAQQMMEWQNGSDPEAPANPIISALEDLQNEVQDVVVGFETRMRRIKRNGERAFSATPDGVVARDPHDSSPDETVSILPIEEEQHAVDGESPAVPPVVLGRSKEEVVAALDRAAGHDTPIASAVPEGESPEQVVLGLANDAEALRTPAAHEEL